MGIYSFLESINNDTTFKYLVVCIIVMAIFSRTNITLGIILGLAVATIIIMYLNEKEVTSEQLYEAEIQKELDTIKPQPEMIKKGIHDDLIDFIFSIQDFYAFNPQAFEEMVDNIDAFLKVYEAIFNEEKYTFYYYQIGLSKKNNALNALHSIIFNLPTNKLTTDKYDRAHKRLETLLNKYLNEIYDRSMILSKLNGYNIHVTPINIGPEASNVYTESDKIFTYQFY
jgi:Na+/H+ antiporter NhaA